MIPKNDWAKIQWGRPLPIIGSEENLPRKNQDKLAGHPEILPVPETKNRKKKTHTHTKCSFTGIPSLKFSCICWSFKKKIYIINLPWPLGKLFFIPNGISLLVWFFLHCLSQKKTIQSGTSNP